METTNTENSQAGSDCSAAPCSALRKIWMGFMWEAQPKLVFRVPIKVWRLKGEMAGDILAALIAVAVFTGWPIWWACSLVRGLIEPFRAVFTKRITPKQWEDFEKIVASEKTHK